LFIHYKFSQIRVVHLGERGESGEGVCMKRRRDKVAKSGYETEIKKRQMEGKE
jgi:hypothetical protein